MRIKPKYRELLILTERYLIHCILPEASVLNNDLQRDFRVQKVLTIYPCGYIDRTTFEGPRLSKLRIKDYKVTIEDTGGQEEAQGLSQISQTYCGFIAPLVEIKALLEGQRKNWREEKNFLENQETGTVIPIRILRHLENVDEARDAITLLGIN